MYEVGKGSRASTLEPGRNEDIVIRDEARVDRLHIFWIGGTAPCVDSWRADAAAIREAEFLKREARARLIVLLDIRPYGTMMQLSVLLHSGSSENRLGI
jgi:hypothetical protein